MKEVTRREAVTRLVTGGAGLALLSPGGAETTGAAAGGQTTAAAAQTVRAFRGQHQPKPLPFDPAKLKGLSEKLIRSHWENNYVGSVRALNAVELRLDAMLKEKELPAY